MSNLSLKKVELIAPAGSPAALISAIDAGADSVYFGVGNRNMRANIRNFSLDEFSDGVKRLHSAEKKAYLTLNTIIFEEELPEIQQTLDKVAELNIDAVICWDYAVIEECKKRNIPIHISTQASISNSTSANYYKNLGAESVVLARECTLEQIIKIRKKTDIDIECFIHGAVCVAVSGRCFMSHFNTGHSANRGDCHQPCRYPYHIKGMENDIEFVVEKSSLLSPKDICTLPILDLLLDAGINKLKIEGRARNADYVKTVTTAYRKAIDAYYTKTLNLPLKEKLTKSLKEVFNREFSQGFYLGRPIDEWAKDGNQATIKKTYLGKIKNFYSKINVLEILLQTDNLKLGDEMMIIGKQCGAVEFTITSIEFEHKKITEAQKGTIVAVKTPFYKKFTKNDKVFLLNSIFDI
ncbi:MAG: peptidase U32 family protein [Verrucomicrobiota bacterium]|nr:peptidase U32 family protein [Verrucomicrobiota bacterium]